MAPAFTAVLSRRRFVAVGGGAALAAVTGGGSAPAGAGEASSLTFAELGRVRDANDHWPSGYQRQVLIRWGDPVLTGAAGAFAPGELTPAEQGKRFGYNNDFTAFLPLPRGSASSTHGLLVVSHEFATPFLMWPGLTEDDYRDRLSDEQIRTLKAALGLSVIEVREALGRWSVVEGSAYARRITLDTEMAIAGPCAGHPRMRTLADPTGRRVIGTMTNCNGGVTPWGTILSGEEGCMDAFQGDHRRLPDQPTVQRQGWDEDDNDRYGLARVDARFGFANEPNEWNRFDWVVEIDPFEPGSLPVKRTALGRFTHEGAQTVLSHDGRVVVFMGDDDDFEYMYRFVSNGTFDANDRAANRDLLDDGVLAVAQYADDGRLEWRPLLHGHGPLTQANGFADQADVLFRTREAADLLGATPMDAPEGFVPNLVTGKLYVALTENEDRLPAGEGEAARQANLANPRGPNPHGHLLELAPPRAAGGQPDWAATTYAWQVLALCGDPATAAEGARFHPATSADGWFTDPDNLGCDPRGRLWICTDGPPPAGMADALYAMDTEGPGRVLPKLFYIPPVGAECCSPCFTPDGRTLFVSVQHPGELRLEDGEDATRLEEAGTTWPDFAPGMPARPSVVVLRREDGREVGA